MEIETRGQAIRVRLNGESVLDGSLDDLIARGGKFPGLQRKSGRIGFQRLGGTVRFRNIRIKELADATTADKTTTFPDKGTIPPPIVVPITKTFFEDFSKTGEGGRPAGWNADDAVNVRKQGDRPRLEVTGKGLRYVSLPAVSLGKNFFLECEFIAASDGTFELTLQGHDGGRDFPISAVASGGFSVYGAALQKVRIPEVDPKASKSREKPEHRLRLEREGDIFRLKVDEETIHARRLPGYGGFSGVRLGLPGGDTPTTKFYWIKMGPLADSPRLEPAPAEPDKAFRQGFRAEFQHAVEGDLPRGWKGDAAVAVRKGDDVRPRLEPAGKGPYSVTTPDVTIEGNFFLELELTVASGAVMEVTLEGRSGGPDLPLSFHGSGGYAGYGASLQNVRLAELEPKTSKTIKGPEHRLRLERQGDVFRLVIDGETIHAQRLPGFKGFARVRLRMANDAAPPTRLFGIKVSPLD